MWTSKVSLVPSMSSKVQTLPTFKLLSLTNVFHPLVSLKFVLFFIFWIIYFAGQILPFNTWRLICLLLSKPKCLLQNFVCKGCHEKEKQLFLFFNLCKFYNKLNLSLRLTRGPPLDWMYDGRMTTKKNGLQGLKELARSRAVTWLATTTFDFSAKLPLCVRQTFHD